MMITSKDFRLVKLSELNQLSHYDKYPDYSRSKYNKDGSTVNIYRSWIARKYSEDTPSKLFAEYTKWYREECGTYDGMWDSFCKLRHIDYDLHYGYYPHNFLVGVPVITELFENRFKNGKYIRQVINAMMFDMKRFNRFNRIGEVYGLSNDIVFRLCKARFEKLKDKISNDRKNGKGLSYSNLRCLITMYEVYDWKSALYLANDVEFKLKSNNKRVHRYPQIVAKEARVKQIDTSVEVVNEKVKINVDSDAVTDDIWASFYKDMKESQDD